MRYLLLFALAYTGADAWIDYVLEDPEPPVLFVAPPEPVEIPGIKKLADGTYDLTEFFKSELRKKEAAQALVCGVACLCEPAPSCCCEGCQCCPCDCGCERIEPKAVQTKERRRPVRDFLKRHFRKPK